VPKNEDGEFELILGNRQLLTVFFIVVVLFGVFFAMGYILGRNSGPMTPEVTTAKKAEKPLVVESPGRDAGREASSAPPAKTEPAPAPPPVETSKPVEVAKAEPKKAEPPPKPEPKKADPPKVEAKKPEPAKPKPEAAKPAAHASAGPVGIYLQLAATAQREAVLYVEELKKKGFASTSVQIPEKPALYRVIVGPLSEGSLGKTKSDLKAAGFPGDRAIKQIYK
jgi:outer membrane biosynthesis protein TonB